MADNHNVKIYRKQGGSVLVIEAWDGGEVHGQPSAGGAPGQAAHIADPTGGATTDAEARTAIDAILVVLENLGATARS